MSRFGFRCLSGCDYEVFMEINSTEKSENKEEKKEGFLGHRGHLDPQWKINSCVWLKYLSDDVDYWVDRNLSLYLSFKPVGLIITILILNRDRETF